MSNHDEIGELGTDAIEPVRQYFQLFFGLDDADGLRIGTKREEESDLDQQHVSADDIDRMYTSTATDYSKRLYFDYHLATYLVFGNEDAGLVEEVTEEGYLRFKALQIFSLAFEQPQNSEFYVSMRKGLLEAFAPCPPPAPVRSKRSRSAYRPLSFLDLDHLLFQMHSFLSMRREYDHLVSACDERKVERHECRELFTMLLGPRKTLHLPGGVPYGDAMRAELLIPNLNYWTAAISKAQAAHPILLAKVLDEFEADVRSFIEKLKTNIVVQHDLPDNKQGVHLTLKDKVTAQLYARMIRRRMNESALARLDAPDDLNARAAIRRTMSTSYSRLAKRCSHWPTEGDLRFFHTKRATELAEMLGVP